MKYFRIFLSTPIIFIMLLIIFLLYKKGKLDLKYTLICTVAIICDIVSHYIFCSLKEKNYDDMSNDDLLNEIDYIEDSTFIDNNASSFVIILCLQYLMIMGFIKLRERNA